MKTEMVAKNPEVIKNDTLEPIERLVVLAVVFDCIIQHIQLIGRPGRTCSFVFHGGCTDVESLLCGLCSFGFFHILSYDFVVLIVLDFLLLFHALILGLRNEMRRDEMCQ